MSGILIVRLGAMGDILHALPAVESLHRSFPDRSISWLVAPRWMALLAGNPAIDKLIAFERRSLAQLAATFKRLRTIHPETAFDFQGLIQSALAGKLSGPQTFWGFSRELLREPLAALFYSRQFRASGEHRVDQNLALVQAAGANKVGGDAWLPEGETDKSLPRESFVLASPFAGWTGKEWPLENYSQLAKMLRQDGLTLLLNVPPARSSEVASLPDVVVHTSSISRLIYATRQAIAVVGVDSGPTHLAAALRKPGVAIYGPTNPATTGPYGSSFRVLRAQGVAGTYKRNREIHGSMRAITVQAVYQSLQAAICDAKVTGAR
jgi:heptosyltransferase I